MTAVKFCGMTRAEDVALACALGVNALGFVFYPPSARAVSVEQAASLCQAVPAFVTRVGLFVDADPTVVQDAFHRAQLNLIQYHGDETPEYCERLGLPYIRAIRMHPDVDVLAEMARHPKASGFLLDAYQPGVPGGTGARFDWQRIPAVPRPLILAGGLTPENAKDAIDTVGPWALDVSGGIESAPGQKDPDKMTRFMAAVGK